MQFKSLVVLALPVFAAPTNFAANQAAELVARADAPVAVSEEAHIEKREIITGIVTSIAITVGTEIATKAVNAGIKLIKDISNWTSAREQFTKATVAEMMTQNPDPKKYAAAICNNVGYNFKNGDGGAVGKVSVDLKQGALKTNYDCFYMEFGNTFFSTGDGGYINLAARHSSTCKFSSGNKKSKPSLVC
ncbi:hypothetical protein RB595_006315 [Gaeumannomyces hyphopodioides]